MSSSTQDFTDALPFPTETHGLSPTVIIWKLKSKCSAHYSHPGKHQTHLYLLVYLLFLDELPANGQRLWFWRNGFSYNQNDLLSYNDPANTKAINDIREGLFMGKTPAHLTNPTGGLMPIELTTVPDTDFVAPSLRIPGFLSTTDKIVADEFSITDSNAMQVVRIQRMPVSDRSLYYGLAVQYTSAIEAARHVDTRKESLPNQETKLFTLVFEFIAPLSASKEVPTFRSPAALSAPDPPKYLKHLRKEDQQKPDWVTIRGQDVKQLAAVALHPGDNVLFWKKINLAYQQRSKAKEGRQQWLDEQKALGNNPGRNQHNDWACDCGQYNMSKFRECYRCKRDRMHSLDDLVAEEVASRAEEDEKAQAKGEEEAGQLYVEGNVIFYGQPTNGRAKGVEGNPAPLLHMFVERT
jgi:hypothetical protein